MEVMEMVMEKRNYRVTFLTPAFLGDAQQQGRWRTPPFKALLRQWWRVVYAADHRFNVNVGQMRHDEGVLFGHAWLEDDRDDRGNAVAARRSDVRLRLDRWDEGKLRSWDGLEQRSVYHPEVQRTKFRIGPHAYLGFGPLDGRGGTKLAKRNAAIQAEEAAKLSFAVPSEQANRLIRAVWLMDLYGTLGGRSRNGWGSARFDEIDTDGKESTTGSVPLRPWLDCLDLDWPHAIGRDEDGPLIWETEGRGDWQSVMRDLAIVKIGLRTQFVFPDAKPPHPAPLDRHWLAYPITKHWTKSWGRNLRLPNTLRFKVRESADGKLHGVIFHVPCVPPSKFKPDLRAIEAVWQRVHRLLDACTQVPDARTYAEIADARRRDALKKQLDEITLKRIPE